MKDNKREDHIYIAVIGALIALITFLHYTTPTTKWQYHLIFMQAYFIPIILAAFRFGVRGGLGSALAVSAFYLPHIMFHWGGLIENNLMRFLQLFLFNILGYLTGLKAQGEKNEKEKYQKTAEKLQEALDKVKILSGFLPICSSCKRIRDDKGYWNQIEKYIKDHSEAEFSHSLCPECITELYPDLDIGKE